MKKEKLKKIIKEVYPYFVIVLVVVLVRSFIITPAIVDGKSMYPTLNDNNIVILNKLDYKINGLKRFDIIVVDYNGEKLIKRVIGLPGEHIEYKNNMLFINGYLTNENFNHDNTSNFKLEKVGYLKIPGDKYFVVGDNRNHSTDSRMIGLIDKKDIKGKVSLRLFPINKFGKIK